MSCRVCFNDSKEKLEIFDNSGREKHIAEILGKHLWFTPLPDEPFSKFVCTQCWTKISDFDEFYETAKKVHDEKLNELKLKNRTLEIENSIEILTDLNKINTVLDGDDLYGTVLIEEIDFSENEKEIIEFQIQDIANEVVSVEADELEFFEQILDTDELIELRKEKTVDSEALPQAKQAKSTENLRSNQNAEDDQIVSKHIILICEICNYSGEFFSDIIKHFAIDHPNTRAFVTCCGRRFTKRERIVQHAWLHEDPKHFQCEICKRVFRDNEIKTAHMKAQHPTEEELVHHCDQCEKRFARPYLLKLHKAVHVPVDERQFFCNKCSKPKAFASQNQLNIHTSMSHNRSPNICDVCGKTIRDRQAFKKHVRLHFEDSGPRVKCPQSGCESWLKDKDNLKQHLRRHNNKSEALQCDQCNKSCKDRRALTCHKRYVHPTTLFDCEVCGKSFKKSISLKEHMATHTGEALYECPFCTQKFKSNANMHAHKKKMHPTEWELCKNLKNK